MSDIETLIARLDLAAAANRAAGASLERIAREAQDVTVRLRNAVAELRANQKDRK